MKMGANHSVDGRQRSLLARMVDPNGLILEETGGWESKTISIRERREDLQNRTTYHPNRIGSMNKDLALHVGDEFLAQRIETERTNSPLQSIMEIEMGKIAPPVVAKWLSSDSSTSKSGGGSTGEEIYMHRRSRSLKSDDLTFLGSLHSKSKSLTGIAEYERDFMPSEGL